MELQLVMGHALMRVMALGSRYCHLWCAHSGEEQKQNVVRSITKYKQESWAMAKMTARCALYMGALKMLGSPWLRPRLPFLNFLVGFCSDRSYECVMNSASPNFDTAN